MTEDWLAWHEEYYSYYASDAYIDTYVPRAQRTTVISQQKTFAKTYKTAIITRSKTATYKSSSGTTVKGSKLTLVSQGMKLSRTPSKLVAPPPALGQHTNQVLKEFGYSTKQIAALRDFASAGDREQRYRTVAPRRRLPAGLVERRRSGRLRSLTGPRGHAGPRRHAIPRGAGPVRGPAPR